MKNTLSSMLLILLVTMVHPGNFTAWAFGGREAVPVADHLMQMERDWAKAITARDTARIKEMVAPEATITTPDGTMQTRDEDLAELASGAFTAELFDVSDMKVRVYGSCAVVTGKTMMKGKYNGEPIDDQFRWTDTFVLRNGTWQIVASQATPIPKAR